MTDKSESFDMNAFMTAMTGDSPDTEALRKEVFADEFAQLMGEMGPRMWAVMNGLMKQQGDNPLHVNACLNAAVFSVLSFAAALIKPDDEASAETLQNVVSQNLEQALASRSPVQAQMIIGTAHNVGTLKLMNDVNGVLAQTVVANSQVMRGLMERIAPREDPPQVG